MTNTTSPMRHQPNPSAPGAPDRRRIRRTPPTPGDRCVRHLNYVTNRLVPPTIHHDNDDDNDDYQQTPRPECWN